MNRTLATGGVAAGLLLISLAGADAAHAAPTRFSSCAEAARAGQVDIPKSSPFYSAALDRDKDGIACDAKDRDAAGAPAAGTSDQSGSDDRSDESGSRDEGTEDDGDGKGDENAQVTVVPEGGAPTGDGSTEGGTGWWVGGGLLAALATAGVAFRGRLARLASPSGR